jgi:transcriptional regulator with XRE-family HTH domain
MILMFDIGSRIIYLRKLHNISANKLAKELSIDPSTINKIEKGTAKPSMDLLFNLCSYFKLSPAEFFVNIQEPKQEFLPPEARRVINKVKGLPPDKLKVLEAVLDTWVD